MISDFYRSAKFLNNTNGFIFIFHLISFMTRLFFVLFFLTEYSLGYSQNLYMPRDIKQAFRNGTRSVDGKPGKNYWQNKGRYNIVISANPPDRTIKGTEQITYVNNSPDALNNLVFKLILNSHRPDAIRYGFQGPDYITAGIQIDAFYINGQQVPWEDPQSHVTWQSAKLPKPLKSKDSVQISVNWHYQVSLQSNREGMIDSTTYFLAYFYPRVAVYDDYQGWDFASFNDALEFYNDFNDYSVNVEVPKNYIVWGTGTLLNAKAVLQT